MEQKLFVSILTGIKRKAEVLKQQGAPSIEICSITKIEKHELITLFFDESRVSCHL